MYKKKILSTCLFSFLVPPLVWNIVMWYSGIVSSSELTTLASYPLQGVFALVFIFLAFILFNLKLNKIGKYINSQKGTKESIQKDIANFPKIYIFLLFVFCLIGPNTGMIGVDFLTRQEYILGLLLSIPLIFLFSVPFIILSTNLIEKWTKKIPLGDKDSAFYIRNKVIVGVVFTLFGSLVAIILFNIALSIHLNDSGLQFSNYLNTYIIRNIVMGLVALVIIMINVVILLKQITTPLHRMKGVLKDMSEGEGDLSKSIKIESRDEFALMSVYINNFVKTLNSLITDLKIITQEVASSSEDLYASGSQVGETAEQVGTAIQQVAAGSEEQLAQVEETTELVKKLLSTIQDVDSNINELSNEGKTIEDNINNGRKSVNNVKEKVGSVKNDTGVVAELINSLGTASDQIGDIVKLINGISTQTNLLALNAAIEAARAGNAGKGFSVVAEEIRKLAEESSNATGRISGLIESIQNDIKEIVEKVNESINSVNETVKTSVEVDNAFTAIESVAKKIQELLLYTSKKARIMDDVSHEVNRTIENVSVVSQDGASNAEEVAASSEQQVAATGEIALSSKHLADLAEKLAKVVEHFKV